MSPSSAADSPADGTITLFLCGDVMTGRGIDQILPHPCAPDLFEPYANDARRYVQLAEEAHGPIPLPVSVRYLWGDALEVWDDVRPDLRIVNLETAITTSDDHWPGKGIHYRMSPKNIGCLTAAGIDCCVLANNHLLDWGYAGLRETLRSLKRAGIQAAGAGQNQSEAEAPAKLDISSKRRVLVFAFGTPSSGIPYAWAARRDRAGVHFLPEISLKQVAPINELIGRHRQRGNLVIASIHWGRNWGYAIAEDERQFAHALVDQAGVDVVHGHSSHHVKGIEVYQGRLILYGCGDFVTDYEGISGYEAFRGDLGIMYFISLDAGSGHFVRLTMVPLQSRRLRLRRAIREDAAWLRETLNRECSELGTRVRLTDEGKLVLEWV